MSRHAYIANKCSILFFAFNECSDVLGMEPGRALKVLLDAFHHRNFQQNFVRAPEKERPFSSEAEKGNGPLRRNREYSPPARSS